MREKPNKEKVEESPEFWAAYSARYILEDLNHEKGIEKMAEVTGMPVGVIISAFKNIFGKDYCGMGNE